MDFGFKLGIILYTIVIIYIVIVSIVIYVKSINKTMSLYTLMVCHTLGVLWLISGMNENMSSNYSELIRNVKITLFPIYFIGPCWFLFSLLHTNKIKRIKYGLLIMLPSVVLYLPLLTEKYTYLVIAKKVLRDPTHNDWGLVYWINYSYSMICAALGVFFLLYDSYSKNKKFVLKDYLIMIAVVLPVGGSNN
ncbi:MAG: histidine kinase N-terminal 7TM domain-containing protein [Bacillota bacterium]|nr:histidine kinase N-terminal 7TM domain-containing protein [Bacillota bacterium]